VHTIDPDFILGIARVSEFGARKYHMRNFLMAPGMPWSQVYGSLMRHLLKWRGGEELEVGPNGQFGPYPDNPEIDMKWSGLPHIHMIGWNVMVLATYSLRAPYQPGDDRPSTIEYKGGIWKDWEAKFEAIREIDANQSAKSEPEAPPVSLMKDPLRTGMMKKDSASEELARKSRGLDLAQEFLLGYAKETGSVVITEVDAGKTVFTIHHR